MSAFTHWHIVFSTSSHSLTAGGPHTNSTAQTIQKEVCDFNNRSALWDLKISCKEINTGVHFIVDALNGCCYKHIFLAMTSQHFFLFFFLKSVIKFHEDGSNTDN